MNYLAVYIDKQSISWVISETETALVIEHGSIPLDSYEKSLADSKSESEEQLRTLSQYPSQNYSTALGFISQSLCSNIEIDLPFSDYKKVEKVIPIQLQDKVPFDLDDIHFAVKQDPTKVGDFFRYFVSYIEKSALDKILLRLKELQINLEVLVSESFFLESLIRSFLEIEKNENNQNTPIQTSVCIGYLSEDVFLESKNNESREAIISLIHNNTTLHVRKLQLPTQENFLFPYLESHIKISLASCNLDPNNLEQNLNTIIFCTESVKDETLNTFKLLTNSKIEKIDPDYSITVNKIANPKLLFTLYSVQSLLYLKQQEQNIQKLVPNLRHGQFRYKAPLTEIKDTLLDHIVPYILVAFFGIFTLVLSFLIPLKESNLIAEKAYQITSQELGRSFKKGSEIQEIDAAISELEQKLGTLSSISSFSPIDWLYTISLSIPKDLNIDIESISITTEGLIFRGTVKDYPTSGRLDSILNKLQTESNGKFCEVSLNTEENVGSQGKKPVVGEIKLCN